jgi:hypothetical protein
MAGPTSYTNYTLEELVKIAEIERNELALEIEARMFSPDAMEDAEERAQELEGIKAKRDEIEADQEALLDELESLVRRFRL